MSNILLDAPNYNGLNCDSESSQLLETPGIPKKTCDMRNVSGMFPEEFNELRRQLFNEHADLWEICGGMLIYNHDMLFEFLNKELQTSAIPGMGIAGACEIWLVALNGRIKKYQS